MNALCHGHLNLVSIHRRRGGRVSTTSEKRHGLRLSLMDAGGKGELDFFGHVFDYVLIRYTYHGEEMGCHNPVSPPL